MTGVPKKDVSQFERNLRDLRSGLTTPSDIFKFLESKELADLNHILENYQLTFDVFSVKYLTMIIRDFLSNPSKQDILFASFGFFEEYDTITVQERHRLFCRYVGTLDKQKKLEKPYDIYWAEKGIDKQMNTKENSTIKLLYKHVKLKFEKGTNKLNYCNNDETIERIIRTPRPSPNYLSCSGYRKAFFEGRTFYVPLKESEKIFNWHPQSDTHKIIATSKNHAQKFIGSEFVQDKTGDKEVRCAIDANLIPQDADTDYIAEIQDQEILPSDPQKEEQREEVPTKAMPLS